jgi:ABC-2 type transport system permease protein
VWIEREIAECERAGAEGRAEHWPPDCEQIRQWQPSQEEMVAWYIPPTFDFRNQFEGLIFGFTLILALFAFLVGASFVGAEWRSGGMTNLLLWRPRRLRVLTTKLTALLTATLGIGVLLAVAWTAALWVVASHRGITETMTAGTWQSFGLTGIRGLTLVLVAGAAGFAIASIGRHTAMALGAAMVALVVGFYGVLIALALVGVDYPNRWLWPTYAMAWMEKRAMLGEEFSCPPDGGECVHRVVEITWQQAGLVIAAVLVVLVGASMWHMARRDVT